jgi:protein-disulfide isomerase
LIEVLFRTQDTWMRSEDPLGELEKLARTAGIDRKRFDACLDDQRLIAAIMERTREAQEKYGITGTPSFIVNGETLVGAVPFDVMRAVLERHIGRR